MNTNATREWARTAVAQLLKRCTQRAARDLETQASELLLAASRLRKPQR
jgi:hypothetical protein